MAKFLINTGGPLGEYGLLGGRIQYIEFHSIHTEFNFFFHKLHSAILNFPSPQYSLQPLQYRLDGHGGGFEGLGERDVLLFGELFTVVFLKFGLAGQHDGSAGTLLVTGGKLFCREPLEEVLVSEEAFTTPVVPGRGVHTDSEQYDIPNPFLVILTKNDGAEWRS